MEQYFNDNFKYTSLIFEACKRLQLSSVSLYAACSVYHDSLDKFDGEVLKGILESKKSVVAVTSVYLASKLEEESCKIRDVLNVCYRILHPGDVPLSIGDRYWNLRDSVLSFELYLLRINKFDVTLDYPQNYLLSYINSLRPWLNPDEWENANVSQIAWNLLQDSFHLPMKEDPTILALAILKLAVDSTKLQIAIEGTSLVWWKAFCADIQEERLEKIACDVLEFQKYTSEKCV